MKAYSFIKPKKKPLFKEDTRLWVIFIIVSFILYLSFGIFLLVKSYFLKKDRKELIKEITKLKLQTHKLIKQKEFIYTQKAIYENILTKNDLVKQQIKNLLDIIPDPITLNRFYIDNNKLIIYGVTPTKEIYNILVLPPLKSIFEETKTYFYKMPNGWYRFKSENYLKSKNEED